ncbi:baseplate hub protein, partial [Xanthomonas pisi]|uniref:baseplate hub protein n=1 Tax=Xanthomonas pisi TaxID=56457 RepID=UPI003CCE35D8
MTQAAPSNPTFKEFVEWSAKQMDIDTVICDTSINNQRLVNPGRTTYVAAALLLEIQNYQRNSIAAYIDDDTLIVKDKDKILNPEQITVIEEFVGIPMWNEWGADFTCMYNA